ncbi:MAG: S8 family serine peptidase, partial [Candidatus Micrarchaeota archaeon]|nr:S8 family serine peptidase [Candidatus Micrarchaeota archaeon]
MQMGVPVRGTVASFVLLPLLLFIVVLLEVGADSGYKQDMAANSFFAGNASLNITQLDAENSSLVPGAQPSTGAAYTPLSTVFVDVDNYHTTNAIGGKTSSSTQVLRANENDVAWLIPGERVYDNPEFVNVDEHVNASAQGQYDFGNGSFQDVDEYLNRTSQPYDDVMAEVHSDGFVKLSSKSRKSSLKVSKEVYDKLKANQTERIIVKYAKKPDKKHVKGKSLVDMPSSSFAVLNADYRALTELLSSDAEAVYPDMQMSVSLSDSIQLVGADRVHNDLGVTGNGVGICLLDTGVSQGAASNVIGGYDFVNEDSGPDDDNGHGTRMAKVINAIAPDATIMPVKVLDSSGRGYSSTIMRGIQYCIQHAAEHNIRIISMSFGGGAFTGYCNYDPIVSIADTAYINGISAVASSGNDGASYITAPACGKNITAVSATTKDDEVAPFSNINGMVDLLAPGEGIIIDGAPYSGTSLSAAEASAAFALLYSYNSSLTPGAAEQAFKTSGQIISHNGNGYARIDAYNALMGIYTGSPTNQTVNQTGPSNYSYSYSAQTYNSVYNAIIAYRSSTGSGLNFPKIRFWNSSGQGSWGNEIELPTAGSPVRYAIVKWSPRSSKIVLVTQSDDGNLDSYVCMGNCTIVANWRVTNNIGTVWTTAPATSSRRFDLDFETRTGDAIVVYAIESAVANRDLAYKVLPAASRNFTGIAEQYIDDTGHATDIQYSWVRVDRNPLGTSEEMILVGFDLSNNDINAWVWNGNAWGNQVSLDDTATRTTGYEAIAAKYAADGSKGMAIGGGLNTVRGGVATRYWSGGAWSAITTFDVDAGDNNDVRWSSLKADPASDDLQGVFIDSGADLHTAYWSGTAWTVTSNIDDAVDTAVARCADFAWSPAGGTGYLAWDTDLAGTTISYRTCAPQCTSATSTASAYAGTGAWITMYTNTRAADTARVLSARLNSNFDIGSFTVNSTTPTFRNYGDAAITADTTVTTYEAYAISFKIDRTPPSITFVSPTPANNSNIFPRNWAFINVTVTDNVNVSFVILEWNGITNYTMSKGPGNSWYRNVTGISPGTYTYRVYAADFSENMNVSVRRTLHRRLPPNVKILEPLGGSYTDFKPVPLAANITDPAGYNISAAWVRITYPNSSTTNISLYRCSGGDNFNSNTVGIGWFVENTSVGPLQKCVANINVTVPGKAFTSLMGNGAPLTDTLCSLVSKRGIYGDFDMNVSFNVLAESGKDYAINFQVTEVPSSADAPYLAYISLSNWDGLGRNYEVFVDDGTTSGYIARRPTTDTSGKFRIRRVGNTMYFYTWNNTSNSWRLENSTAVNFINTLHVTLESESTYAGWGYINASWDDLQIKIKGSSTVYFNEFNTQVHPVGRYNVTFYARNSMGVLNGS